MPAGTFKFRDKRTSKVYEMPWDTRSKAKPTREELDSFVSSNTAPEESSLYEKAFTPVTNAISRTVNKYIAEPLMQYGEGQGLDIAGLHIADKYKKGDTYGIGRKAAQLAGGMASSLGNTVESSIASPGGAALTLAGPVGKGLQMTGKLARAGSAVRAIPKVAGGAAMAHGGYGLSDIDYSQDLGDIASDAAGPILETGLGALGAFGPKGIATGGRKVRSAINSVRGKAPINASMSTGSVVSQPVQAVPGMVYGETPSAPVRGTGRVPMFGEPLPEPRLNAKDLYGPTGRGQSPIGSGVTESPGLLGEGAQYWKGQEAPTPPKPFMRGTSDAPDFSPYSPYKQDIQGAFRQAVPERPIPGAPMPQPPGPGLTAFNEGYAQQPKLLGPGGARFVDPEGGVRSALGDITWPGESKTPTVKSPRSGVVREMPQLEPETAPTRKAKPPTPKKKPVPTTVDIEVEDLRNPTSSSRAKYSQKSLDKIDMETLADEKLVEKLGKKGASALRKRLENNPVLKRFVAKMGEEKGAVSLDVLTGGVGEKVGKGLSKFGKKVGEARQRGLDNIKAAEEKGVFGSGKTKKVVEAGRKTAAAVTGPDVTDASLAPYYRSGWDYLEGMGDPGKKLARLLKRARTDTNIELEDMRSKGAHLTDTKGKLINRTGGLIMDRHGDEIEALVNQIKDPEQQAQANAILKKFRGGDIDVDKPFNRGADAIRGIHAATKLSQFGISNPAGVVPTLMRGDVRSVFKNVGKVLPGRKAAYAAAKKLAKESGSLVDVPGSIMEESGKNGLSKLADKLYRISGSESRMRTMATLVGRDTAESLFQKLKANPTNKNLLDKLDDLLLEDDVPALLRQSKLSDHQLRRAGGRMAELTQGIAEGIDLPPKWTGDSTADLLTQFKKFSYAQTKNMASAFKRDPVKAATALGVGGAAMGEAIGDTKAAIKGAVKAGVEGEDLLDTISDEISARGQGLGRVTKNMSQAWAFGIFGDLLEGAKRGVGGVAETLGGPTIGDIGEFGSGLYKLANEGDSHQLKRAAARLIPYVGTAYSNTIKGSYEGRQQRRRRESRPSR